MKAIVAGLLFLLLGVSAAWSQGFPNPGPGAPAATAAADTTPPSVPSLTGIVIGSPFASLTWSHANPSDVDHYLVRYRCPSGSGGYTVINVPGGSTDRYDFSDLPFGVSCNFSAAAVDSAVNASAYTVDLTATMSGSPTYPVANGVELRCSNLGTAATGTSCICSEPLNGNEGGVEIDAVNFDFASSNSTYGCNRSGTAAASISPSPSGGHYPVMAATTAFGSSGWALQQGTGHGYSFIHGRKITDTSTIDATHTQLCWRIYKLVSSNYGNTGGDLFGPRGECAAGTTWRNKIAQLNFANQSQAFQPEEQNYTDAICHTGGPYGNIDGGNDSPPPGGGWFGVLNMSPPVDWSAAKVKPIRIEFCAESRDAGGVRGGNKITVRTRIKRLDTGVISRTTTPETTGWGTISGYDSSGIDADHTGPGTELYGFFIQTRSTADPDVTTHWPGCAPEVEGDIACPIAGGD